MTTDQVFGRRPAPDSRDSRYPMRRLLGMQDLSKYASHRYYPTGPHLPLDQGQTGTCVAQAWTGFLYAALKMDKTAPSPFDTYREIVKVDEFDDNDVEATAADADLQAGTSVRAGAKVLQAQGRLASYVWATNADEAGVWLLKGNGTLVLGTNWYQGMSRLANGLATADGNILGGHAYLCVGYNRYTRLFRCLNSWGADFGDRGRFWIGYDDMNRLLAEDGECCAAVERVVAPL